MNEQALLEAMWKGMAGGARETGSDMAGHMPTLYVLARMFGFGRLVELGVSKGFSTVALLAGAASVDAPLTSYDRNPECEPWAKETMGLPPDHQLLSLWRFRQKDSVAAAAEHTEASVSLLFLDTDHTLPVTRAELAAWLPKIHPKGAIAGHDYCLKGAGVAQAVGELVKVTGARFRLHVSPHDQGFFILFPA